MSPALEFDSPEIDFVDWAENAEPLDAQLEDFQAETPGSREYYKRLDLPDGLERLVSHADVVAWDKSRGMLIARAKYFRRRNEIRSALRTALSLTKLRDNWDGEESAGYSITTWRRVKGFLLKQVSLSDKLFRQSLPTPQINPADKGSIDVFWRLDGRQLLLNFPSSEDAPITYHAQDATATNTISGRTAGDEFRPDLVAWLIQTPK